MSDYFGQGKLESYISREAYASDGSIYRIMPEKVFCPTSEEQAVSIVLDALANGKTITPRGGGTGLAGGAIGGGYIIDCSRLTAIKNIDIDKKTVSCQPGIIYRDLNLALKEKGLFFPPDPSSGDSCQIGGMLANNSSGPRSVKYGLTSAYVEELTIVTKDGTPLTLRKLPLGEKSTDEFLDSHPEYRTVLQSLQQNSELIRSSWPKVKKNSAGYNLLQVAGDLEQGIFNLPALYVGSEGTLGLFLSVTLSLLPLPGKALSYRLFFDSLEAAGDAVAPLLATGPSALEIVDGATLGLIGRDKYQIPQTVEAMLLLEYDDDHDRHRSEVEKLALRLTMTGPPEEAADEKQRQSLWAARKAVVPTLYKHHATKRPFGFIEDASIPVDRLTEFIAWTRQRLQKENLIFGMVGHIGDGNLHIRPLLDMKIKAEFELTKRLYDEVYEKIFELGGSSTAEHADGRLRAPVLRRLYGDEIVAIFTAIKETLDPEYRFNPDVILSSRLFTDDLDFKKLELFCAACGKCNGYCPAFEVFRREDMSPRGWLRMLHQGNVDDKELDQFYQYCVNCKNCTTVCPAGVDIAGEILKFKATHPHKNAGRVISVFDRKGLFSFFLKTGSIMYPLTDSTLGRKFAALVGGRTFGIDDQAVFPKPAFKSLRERHPDLCRSNGVVALFHGCADNYFDTTAGDALIEVFDHYGWDLAMPEQTCCGLPMEVYGHRDNLIEKAKLNIDSLLPFEVVVFTCASCLHRLADYHELFDDGSEYHQKALALKDRMYDLSQFLLDKNIDVPHYKESGRLRVSYHHPCHLRASRLESYPVELIQRITGITLLHPDRAGRCCGQAGSFGYTHYQEGQAAFAAKKAEYDRMNVDIIFSSCPSCIAKVQKEMGPSVRVCHPIEIIADILAGRRLYDKRE